jgi:hypothetical protein
LASQNSDVKSGWPAEQQAHRRYGPQCSACSSTCGQLLNMYSHAALMG